MAAAGVLPHNFSQFVEPALKFLARVTEAIRPELRQELSAVDPCLEVHGMDQGFFVRPALFLIGSGADMQSYDASALVNALPALVGLELLQQSTLIIDDIIDEAPLRNGYPSAWTTVGKEAATCLGHQVLLAGLDRLATAETSRAASLVSMLISAFGEVYEGQRLDVASAPLAFQEYENYKELIWKTTGSFLEASLLAGAVSSSAGAEAMEMLSGWARIWGVAYQMRDDVLDYCESEITGKQRYGDLQAGKLRLPVVLGLNDASAAKPLREGLDRLTPDNLDSIETLVGLMAEQGLFAAAVERVGQLCYTACEQLGAPLTCEQVYLLSALSLETAHFKLPKELWRSGRYNESA